MNFDKETREIIGLVSGILVWVSSFPYAIRICQGKIRPNITSWILWTIIGLLILLTYKGSGAKANIWPAIFGFINPLVITTLSIYKRGEKTHFTNLEYSCVVFCSFSLILWFVFKGNPKLVQYALYLALIADTFAGIPTIEAAFKKPELDRPGAWGIFGIAYILALLAITDHTFSNYILPIFMFVTSWLVTVKLALPKIRNGTLRQEWI